MRIEWKITKKRGNIRPLLTYCVELEEHEKALALPCVSIMSTIPKPDEDWQQHCYPGQFERAEPPVFSGFYILESPSHKGHNKTHVLRLPWRADNEYPEVNASFLLLRQALEEELLVAGNSLPMDVQDAMQTSCETKVRIAPNVLAERFLRLAMQTAQQNNG